MNLEELIKKYLGEWLGNGVTVRLDYYHTQTDCWAISYFSSWDETTHSTVVWCSNIEKGLEILRERLEKKV